ncbi:MAG: hypothetical protein QF775_00270, partial [archaeon]|nr:hypothetical protein [archaeon]
QERENNISLIRRFSRRLRESGILSASRKARFKDRPKSHQMQKRAALRRLEKKAEYEKMRKMGKAYGK